MKSGDEFTISDCNGAYVLRYWKIGDDQYFGGPVGDWALELMPFAFSPHTWHTTGSVLGVIGNIARMDAKLPYLLQGAVSGQYDQQQIGRLMDAGRIARIIGCSEQEVCDFYRLLVEIADTP